MRSQVWARVKDRKQKSKNKIRNSDRSKTALRDSNSKNQMKIGNRIKAGVIVLTTEIVHPETTIKGTKTEIVMETTTIDKIRIEKG